MTLARNFFVILATLILHGGCTESFEVLSHEDAGTPWTQCEAALKSGRSGERCEGFRGCVTRTPDGCCSRVAECVEGVLDLQEQCLQDCPGTCAGDGECVFGREWCTDGRCTPCLEPPPGCFDTCPRGWIPRTRNGCYTCECVPPSQCYDDAKCGAGLVCYAGDSCASGCEPANPSCCEGNFCSTPGCVERPPMGCMTTGCPQGSVCVIRDCVPTYCRCDPTSRTWRCTTDCEGGVCVPVQ